MTTASLNHTDVRVRDEVMRQLDGDPEVDASAVGVAAKNGVVTLTGYMNTYSGKLAAERAAKRVRGVRAVANDIGVRPMLGRVDADIAADVARGLELHSTIPEGVQAAVHHGYVTLTGRVSWLYQKRQAEKAVRHVRGLRGVLNHIEVVPRAVERDERHRIVQALHPNAKINAHHVIVAVTDGVATLTGTVGSWLQRDAAERDTAAAPGIKHVENRLLVDVPPPEPGDTVDEMC
jgi:osmotically-inducible protein OsmY